MTVTTPLLREQYVAKLLDIQGACNDAVLCPLASTGEKSLARHILDIIRATQ